MSDETIEFVNVSTGVKYSLPLHLALRKPLPEIVGKFYNPLRTLDPFFIPLKLSTYDDRV